MISKINFANTTVNFQARKKSPGYPCNLSHLQGIQQEIMAAKRFLRETGTEPASPQDLASQIKDAREHIKKGTLSDLETALQSLTPALRVLDRENCTEARGIKRTTSNAAHQLAQKHTQASRAYPLSDPTRQEEIKKARLYGQIAHQLDLELNFNP